MVTVLYTAIYGDYDVPKHQPEQGCSNVLYTDNPRLHAPGWTVRVDPLEHIATPMMKAKWWKCRPDLAVPEADVAVWIDGSVLVRREDYVDQCVKALSDCDALFYTHPHRTCVWDEALISATMSKYDSQDVMSQAQYYLDHGHPRNWGLFAAGLTVRRLTPSTQELGIRWWDEINRFTFQDQLSLSFVVRTMEKRLRWRTWGEDMDWETLWSITR